MKVPPLLQASDDLYLSQDALNRWLHSFPYYNTIKHCRKPLYIRYSCQPGGVPWTLLILWQVFSCESKL